MRYRPIVAFAQMSALVVSGLAAQGTTARVLVGGGTATDLRGVRSAAYSLAPSLVLAPDPEVALSIGARGTRFNGGEWSLAGSGAFALRGRLGAGLSLLLNGSGDAVRTSYHATYLSADGIPSVEWRRGAFSLWAGAHAATARTTSESFVAHPTLVPGTGRLSRSVLGPAFGGTLQLAGLEGRSAGLSYREEHSRPEGVPVVDRTAGLNLSQGLLTLNASIGRRFAADESRMFGGGRLALAVTPAVALIGAAESYPSNRLTGTPGGRAFTAGLSLSLGGPRGLRPLPQPAGVPRPPAGATRLALAAPEASRVEVAGDWNGWQPVALTRSTNGVWYADLPILPGVYRYAYRIDSKTWEVPKGVAAVNDGFGGRSAWLTVRESGRTAAQSANRKEAP